MLQVEARIVLLPESKPHTWWGAAFGVISAAGKCWARHHSAKRFSHQEAILWASAPSHMHHSA